MTGDVQVARGVGSRSPDVVLVSGAADVAAVDEPGPRGVHLGDEAVVVAAAIRQLRSNLRREGRVDRAGGTGDVGVAVRIHRDVTPALIVISADVPRVEQLRAISVHLGDERLLPAVEGHVRPDGYGKTRLWGVRRSRDVGVPAPVDGYAATAILAAGPADVVQVHELPRAVDLAHEGVHLSAGRGERAWCRGKVQ